MFSQASCDILQSHPRELQSQHGDISSKTCHSISSQRISPTPNFVQPLLTRACKYAAACALTAGLVLRKRATMAISKESKKAFLDQELDMQHGCTSMKWGSIETYWNEVLPLEPDTTGWCPLLKLRQYSHFHMGHWRLGLHETYKIKIVQRHAVEQFMANKDTTRSGKYLMISQN